MFSLLGSMVTCPVKAKVKLSLYTVKGLGNQNIVGATKPSVVVVPGTTRHKNKFRTLGFKPNQLAFSSDHE